MVRASRGEDASLTPARDVLAFHLKALKIMLLRKYNLPRHFVGVFYYPNSPVDQRLSIMHRM
jgi:hypothetical protein